MWNPIKISLVPKILLTNKIRDIVPSIYSFKDQYYLKSNLPYLNTPKYVNTAFLVLLVPTGYLLIIKY